MTDPELDALLEKAEKATPGPWWVYRPRKNNFILGEGGVYVMERTNYGVHQLADAEWIAAANPDTIRALVLALREARARAEQSRVAEVETLLQLSQVMAERDQLDCSRREPGATLHCPVHYPCVTCRMRGAEAEVARLKERVLEYKEAEQHVLRQWREQEAQLAQARAERDDFQRRLNDAQDDRSRWHARMMTAEAEVTRLRAENERLLGERGRIDHCPGDSPLKAAWLDEPQRLGGCDSRNPTTGEWCGRDVGHTGDHVGYGDGSVRRVWSPDAP